MFPLGQLPTEILSLIVEQLEHHKDVYTCTLINKIFYSIANPLLWRTLDLWGDDSLLMATKCIFLSKQPLGRHIRKLDLHVRLTNTTFLLFIQNLGLLDELNLRDAQLITDASFQHLPQHCPELQSLHLCNASITRYSMQRLGLSCHQLRKLNLDCCTRLSPDSFSSLIGHCPLKELSISGDDPSGLYGKHWLTVDQTAMDLTHFDSLTHLTLAYWSAPFFSSILTTTNSCGGVPWPQLTHLYLDECNGIGDEHLIPFIKLHPRLNTIFLSFAKTTDATLVAISAYLPGVTRVGLISNNYITVCGVRLLVQKCPLLKNVNFDGGRLSVMDFPEAYDQSGVGGDDDENLEILDELQQTAIDRIRHELYSSNHSNN